MKKLICFAIVTLAAASSFSVDPLFDPPVSYAVGDGPISCYPTDINHDGFIDLIVANNLSGGFTALLNDGVGVLAPSAEYPMDQEISWVSASDLNGDSDIDIVTANHGAGYDGTVSIRFGVGDGSFGSVSNYHVGNNIRSIVCRDFDLDGDIDLAIARQHTDRVGIMFNSGLGSFTDPVYYQVGDYPAAIASADFDLDGDIDIITCNGNSDNVTIILNHGDGTFSSPVSYPVGNLPINLASGDMDGDGDMDLVVANRSSNNVSVLLNNGNGVFTPSTVVPAGDWPLWVALGDIDADGDLDIAVCNFQSDDISVLMNKGDSTFGPQILYSVGDGPSSIAAADLNGDGSLDLMCANWCSDDVTVLLQSPSGGPDDGYYTEVASMPTSRWDMEAFSYGDYIYCFAGVSGDEGSVEYGVYRYDVTHDLWEITDSTTFAGWAIYSALIGDDVYFAGGGIVAGWFKDSVFRYNIPTGQVDTLTNLPEPLINGHAFNDEGRFHLLGGHNGGAPYSANYIYNPATSLWSSEPFLPAGLESYGLAQFDTLVHLIGGRGLGGYPSSDINLVYNTRSHSYSYKTPMPTHTRDAACAILDSEIYVFGGRSGNVPAMDTVQIYDPVTDTWRDGPPLPFPNAWMNAVTHGESIYLIGGNDFVNGTDRVFRFSPSLPTAVRDVDEGGLPTTYVLGQNYPNPFNPSTQIAFELPTRSQVTLTVYNVLGQQVATLVNEQLSAGSYVTEWNGRSLSGVQVSSGIYFYRLQTESFTQAKKMILLK